MFVACRQSPNQITIEVDQGEITLSTQAETVREALAEAEVTLNELDRVKPDLNYQLKPVMSIEVIRVSQSMQTITQTIPYNRQVVVNEALAPDEQRLAQLGINGLQEALVQVTVENGIEVERLNLEEKVLLEPVDEILLVGRREDLGTVPISGTIVYLSGRNAWLMKDSSEARRPLTQVGDLDGHVLSLSPDGSQLLYSRSVTDVLSAPLNEVWLIDTVIVGEDPISLALKSVLYAQWSPLISQTLVAYSTAQRVPSQPGWRANNDLWLWDVSTPITQAVQILEPNNSRLYAWWGTNFAWSPNGVYIAYANASEVGVIELESQKASTLKTFEPYQTNSDWVWVPSLSWSPDGQFLATVIHSPPLQNEPPTLSQGFDVWLLAVDGSLEAMIREKAGIWSNPIWHSNGLTFGQALQPLQSANSAYQLVGVDVDGSNAHTRFSTDFGSGLSFPEMAWAKGQDDLLFVYQNDLYLLPDNGLLPQKLTADGLSRQPIWVLPNPNFVKD